MENLQVLGSLATQLHGEFQKLFYLILPVFLMLALVIAWFRHPMGSPEFLDIIKRTVVAALLLAAFPEIANTVKAVTDSIAAKISDMSGLETYLRMTKEKAAWHASNTNPMTLIWQFNDIFVATLAFLSYVILYLARYFMVAVYHFTWTFLIILSPLLLLFHLFTSKITMNLFRTLIEVACWQIVWAVLSAMLDSLAFGDFQKVDGQHFTLIIMNFVIALSLFLTPMLVKGLVGGSFSAVASSLAPLAATTVISLPVKGAAITAKGRQVLSTTGEYARGRINQVNRGNWAPVARNQIAEAYTEHKQREGQCIERPAQGQKSRSNHPLVGDLPSKKGEQ